MRSFWAVVAFGVLLVATRRPNAEVPVGSWKVNGDGRETDLIINSIDDAGNVEGTVYGDRVRGVYDKKTKCLSFLRYPSEGPDGTYQAWKGYVFDGGSDHIAIAGTFQMFRFGRDVHVVENGWYGKMPRPQK